MQITNACITQKTHVFDPLASMVSTRTKISIAGKFWVRDNEEKKRNKINPKLLYHILFQLYLWNSTKSFGSCSNMIWNNKKHSFVSKPIWTVIFHRSAHLMLSKLEKAWAEFNFFPPPFFFGQKSRNIHPTVLPPPFTFSRGILDQPVKSEKEKMLFVEKRTEGKQDGELQSKFLCWQKCSVFQMVGERSWLHSCGKNCKAKYLPGALSLLLCAIVLPSSTPCCLVQKLNFHDKLTV